MRDDFAACGLRFASSMTGGGSAGPPFATSRLLGEVLLCQDRVPEAERLLEHARAAAAEPYFGRRSERSAATLALGNLERRRGRLDESETLIRDAVAIDAQVLPEEDPDRAPAITALGETLILQGRFADAVRILTPAARMLVAPDPKGKRAATELALARAHVGVGDTAAARGYARAALRSFERVEDPARDHSDDAAGLLASLGGPG